MTVSKSWVARLVRERRLEIEGRRREWKRRLPRPAPVNLVWGLDLTAKGDVLGTIHPWTGFTTSVPLLAPQLSVSYVEVEPPSPTPTASSEAIGVRGRE